jgi:uncharacterized protein
MVALPEEVVAAFANRDGPAVLTTVDAHGKPNTVYCGATRFLEDGRVSIANNRFAKTFANLEHTTVVSVLFLDKERKSYQIKGSFEYLTSGPEYDHMKTWNAPPRPGIGVLVISPLEVYSGSKQLA